MVSVLIYRSYQHCLAQLTTCSSSFGYQDFILPGVSYLNDHSSVSSAGVFSCPLKDGGFQGCLSLYLISIYYIQSLGDCIQSQGLYHLYADDSHLKCISPVQNFFPNFRLIKDMWNTTQSKLSSLSSLQKHILAVISFQLAATLPSNSSGQKVWVILDSSFPIPTSNLSVNLIVSAFKTTQNLTTSLTTSTLTHYGPSHHHVSSKLPQ